MSLVRGSARGARPGAAKVEVSNAHGDSLELGLARVRLKLAAIAYAHAQFGLDAERVSKLALEVLCEAGRRYHEILTGRESDADGDSGPLQVAALGYVHARHGVDASVDLARAGLGALCEAAVRLCEGS